MGYTPAHTPPIFAPMSPGIKTKMRALVVDDDETVLDHVSQVLRRMNFAVEPSFDGLDALRRRQSARYGIVVCDIRMPRLSGFSLLSNIGQTINEETRVVVISALDDDSLRKQALASGASAKPIKPLTREMSREAIGDEFVGRTDPI